jgi:hypothetical protein
MPTPVDTLKSNNITVGAYDTNVDNVSISNDTIGMKDPSGNSIIQLSSTYIPGNNSAGLSVLSDPAFSENPSIQVIGTSSSICNLQIYYDGSMNSNSQVTMNDTYGFAASYSTGLTIQDTSFNSATLNAYESANLQLIDSSFNFTQVSSKDVVMNDPSGHSIIRLSSTPLPDSVYSSGLSILYDQSFNATPSIQIVGPSTIANLQIYYDGDRANSQLTMNDDFGNAQLYSTGFSIQDTSNNRAILNVYESAYLLIEDSSSNIIQVSSKEVKLNSNGNDLTTINSSINVAADISFNPTPAIKITNGTAQNNLGMVFDVSNNPVAVSQLNDSYGLSQLASNSLLLTDFSNNNVSINAYQASSISLQNNDLTSSNLTSNILLFNDINSVPIIQLTSNNIGGPTSGLTISANDKGNDHPSIQITADRPAFSISKSELYYDVDGNTNAQMVTNDVYGNGSFFSTGLSIEDNSGNSCNIACYIDPPTIQLTSNSLTNSILSSKDLVIKDPSGNSIIQLSETTLPFGSSSGLSVLSDPSFNTQPSIQVIGLQTSIANLFQYYDVSNNANSVMTVSDSYGQGQIYSTGLSVQDNSGNIIEAYAYEGASVSILDSSGNLTTVSSKDVVIKDPSGNSIIQLSETTLPFGSSSGLSVLSDPSFNTQPSIQVIGPSSIAHLFQYYDGSNNANSVMTISDSYGQGQMYSTGLSVQDNSGNIIEAYAYEGASISISDSSGNQTTVSSKDVVIKDPSGNSIIQLSDTTLPFSATSGLSVLSDPSFNTQPSIQVIGPSSSIANLLQYYDGSNNANSYMSLNDTYGYGQMYSTGFSVQDNLNNTVQINAYEGASILILDNLGNETIISSTGLSNNNNLDISAASITFNGVAHIDNGISDFYPLIATTGTEVFKIPYPAGYTPTTMLTGFGGNPVGLTVNSYNQDGSGNTIGFNWTANTTGVQQVQWFAL